MSHIQTLQHFYSQHLNNKRNIHIYLPDGYAQSNETYPVLYMHDGQNLFDKNISFDGSTWEMKENLDKLIKHKLIQKIIVVGIENNENRTNEFSHYSLKYSNFGRLGLQERTIDKPLGDKYELFLIDELKPFIDKHYKTKTQREYTAIMGSSMGGNLSYIIAKNRPDIFSKVGMLSPAIQSIHTKHLEVTPKVNQQFYIDVGTAEAHYVENTRWFIKQLLKQHYKQSDDFYYYEAITHIHHETDWAKRVINPLLYFFGSVGQIDSAELILREEIGINGMSAYLNPILTTSHGFTYTDLEAKMDYNPNNISISHDNHIKGISQGKTTLTYFFSNKEIKKEVKVIEHLSETVKIDFSIKVPKNTLINVPIFIEDYSKLRLYSSKDSYYIGTLEIPRDWSVAFRFIHPVHGVESKLKPRIIECHQDGSYKGEISSWQSQS